ncbi:MAG TPA: response regulator [Planctomycetota bacterium]|nr:response regulator [Planctomycetota bacterium]
MGESGGLVYLVHPHSDVLLSLYEVLAAAGFDVAASSNAAHALDYVARSRPGAVLCHWDMPELGGTELLGRLRQASPETRVIMTSGQADARMYDLVRGRGGDDLLREPLSGLSVVQAVSRMLGLSIPYTPTDPVAFPDPELRGNEERRRRSS